MPSRVTFAVGNKVFQGNRIFSAGIRDQANTYLITLKESLAASGVDLATEDINPPESAAIVIDVNVQKRKQPLRRGAMRYLLTVEPPVICPENFSPAAHAPYDKIFTWNDKLVDNRKYFMLRYAHNLGMESGLPGFKERRFAVMIIGFKSSSNPQEQYSARFDTIRWFLQNYPSEFHLYGVGWPPHLRPPASYRMERFLSGPINFLTSPFYPKNGCYRGRVADKLQTSRNYRFAFCYENTHSEPGYITEKIFDAFRAGCIPIYLGPPNAPEQIPDNCYIDRRRFSSHEELYEHLTGVSADQFFEFQNRIRSYLASPEARQFTPSHFASVLREHIVTDLGVKAEGQRV